MPVQLNLFDLNLLRALDALLAERNVTRASVRCRIARRCGPGYRSKAGGLVAELG